MDSNNMLEKMIKNSFPKIREKITEHDRLEGEYFNSYIINNTLNGEKLEKYRILHEEQIKTNDLENFFFYGKHRMFTKWSKYFDVYDRHMSKFRNVKRSGKPVILVEIGVFRGGSLQMWKEYLGPDARIIGIDINPECKKYEEDQIEIFIGSQDDRRFWADFRKSVYYIDILIDDGGHLLNQQRVTFEETFNMISEEGVYICEDCMTSYFPIFGGGYKSGDSFIELGKDYIDSINADYSRDERLKANGNTRSLYAMHFYDQMVVFEKSHRAKEINYNLESYERYLE